MNLRLTLVLLGSAVAVLADPGRIAPDVPRTGAAVRVIVQYRSAPQLSDLAGLAALGGTPELLKAIPAVAVELPPSGLDLAAALPGVLYISPNRVVRGSSAAGTNAAIARHSQAAAHVTVAVTGSGIPSSSRVVYRESFVETVAAAGKTQDRLAGPSLVDLQVLTADGAGSDLSVIRAVSRAIELKDQYGIRVLVVPLARRAVESYQLDPLCRTVEAAWKAGLIVVVAAGDFGGDEEDGYGTIASPGNDPYVLTAGSLKPGSSKGPTRFDRIVKPDLIASVEQAGAAAAAIVEQDLELTPEQVKARMMATASKDFAASTVTVDAEGRVWRTQYDIFTVGAGTLDLLAALSSGATPAGPALSPAVSVEAGQILLQVDPSSAWSALGGLPAVWGRLVFLQDAAGVSGFSACWGFSAGWGNRRVIENY